MNRSNGWRAGVINLMQFISNNRYVKKRYHVKRLEIYIEYEKSNLKTFTGNLTYGQILMRR